MQWVFSPHGFMKIWSLEENYKSEITNYKQSKLRAPLTWCGKWPQCCALKMLSETS